MKRRYSTVILASGTMSKNLSVTYDTFTNLLTYVYGNQRPFTMLTSWFDMENATIADMDGIAALVKAGSA